MLIAKVNGNEIVEIADYKAMFPNTSFAVNGPEQTWMTDNSCLHVSLFVEYNHDTEELQPTTP